MKKTKVVCTIGPASEQKDCLEKLIGTAGMNVMRMNFSHGDYEGDEQQLPAMFILDENGVATYVHYAANIMDMPTVDEVLNLL